MNKKGRGRFVLIMFAALIVFLAVYYFVANGKRDEGLQKLSATEATVQRDLSINYPQTPKAVVRYYAELSQCMYDPTNSDEEVREIAMQSRLLFDDELKARQTDEQYLESLKATIAAFLNDNRRIVSFTISPSSEVVYDTLDIGDVASLYCTYTMQKGPVSYSDPEHFLLRRDSEGRWKILGWQSASTENGAVTGDTGAAGAADSSGAAGSSGASDSSGDSGSSGAPDASGASGSSGASDFSGASDAGEVVIEKPTVEIPTVEIEVPGVKR